MAEALRRKLLGWLRVDLEPHLPPGSEGGCEVFRAGLAYLRYRQIAWCLKQAGTLAGIVGVFVFLQTMGDASFPIRFRGLSDLFKPGMWVFLEVMGLATFLVQLPFTWLAIRWDYDCRWYLLSERCLRLQEGILTLKEQTFTLANIQDIQVRQNPLQRLFDLWDVEVRTAGGGEDPMAEQGAGHGASLHTALLRGVADGAAIRDRLLARMAEFKDAGLGELPKQAEVDDPGLAAALADVRGAAASLRLELGT